MCNGCVHVMFSKDEDISNMMKPLLRLHSIEHQELHVFDGAFHMHTKVRLLFSMWRGFYNLSPVLLVVTLLPFLHSTMNPNLIMPFQRKLFLEPVKWDSAVYCTLRHGWLKCALTLNVTLATWATTFHEKLIYSRDGTTQAWLPSCDGVKRGERRDKKNFFTLSRRIFCE